MKMSLKIKVKEPRRNLENTALLMSKKKKSKKKKRSWSGACVLQIQLPHVRSTVDRVGVCLSKRLSRLSLELNFSGGNKYWLSPIPYYHDVARHDACRA